MNVEVRFLKFLGGMAILYQNHSKNYVFNEEVRLELTNLKPANFELELLLIELEPGQDRLLLMRAIKPRL